MNFGSTSAGLRSGAVSPFEHCQYRPPEFSAVPKRLLGIVAGLLCGIPLVLMDADTDALHDFQKLARVEFDFHAASIAQGC